MQPTFPTRRILPTLLAIALLAALPAAASTSLALPWREAGLSEREAAAHLLDRFAYGARPGDVDRLVAMGLEKWLERQLRGGLPDPEVDMRLRGFDSLGLSALEASETYPQPFLVLREAERAGIVDREALAEMRARADEPTGERRFGDSGETRRKVFAYARQQGYGPMGELLGETMVQKLYRAVYSENQLSEVLTDFWLNHFNVSLTDNESRVYIASYERDAIRPFVLGSFRAMLKATAKHPAMLHYLDNARSVADEGARTTFDADAMRRRYARRGFGRGGFGRAGFGSRGSGGMDAEMRRRLEERRPQGLNENYARELMELHTLGVDGGYTQEDVVEVARAFTGWTTYPPGSMRREVEERVTRARRLPASAGFMFEESFLFRADAHDAGKKTILGRAYPAGRGMADCLQVLDVLAVHPSTARHLATKLAKRFVSDDPPAALVDRLADRYLETRGDLGKVMRTLAELPEFWSRDARQEKIKSPFELACSALRALDADVREPRSLIELITRMGQPLYAYQAPTGYPDSAETCGQYRLAAQPHELRSRARHPANRRGAPRPRGLERQPRTRVPVGGTFDLRAAAFAGTRSGGDRAPPRPGDPRPRAGPQDRVGGPGGRRHAVFLRRRLGPRRLPAWCSRWTRIRALGAGLDPRGRA